MIEGQLRSLEGLWLRVYFGTSEEHIGGFGESGVPCLTGLYNQCPAKGFCLESFFSETPFYADTDTNHQRSI